MQITVDVSQDDVDDSPDAASRNNCPIARALGRIIKSGVYFSVNHDSLAIGNDTWLFDGQIPHQLNVPLYRVEELTFDGLEPFSFTMQMPGHYFDEVDYCNCGCNDRDEEDYK